MFSTVFWSLFYVYFPSGLCYFLSSTDFGLYIFLYSSPLRYDVYHNWGYDVFPFIRYFLNFSFDFFIESLGG